MNDFVGIQLVINPVIAPLGKPTSILSHGMRLTLCFHSDAELQVWLDQMREQGLQG